MGETVAALDGQEGWSVKVLVNESVSRAWSALSGATRRLGVVAAAVGLASLAGGCISKPAAAPEGSTDGTVEAGGDAENTGSADGSPNSSSDSVAPLDDGGVCMVLARTPVAPAVDWTPGKEGKSAPLFDQTTVPEFALEFEESDWAKVMATWRDPKWNSGLSTIEVEALWAEEQGDAYVPCTFTFQKQSANAVCRLRGSPEYWRTEYKPELRIKFDKIDKNARFLGLRAISLESAPYTTAPVRDRVAAWFMDQVELPAARVNNIRLSINRAKSTGGTLVDFGVYLNLEVIDREFVERWYPDPDGYLYEGGWQRKTNTKDPPNTCDWIVGDTIEPELLGGTHDAMFAELEKLMDVDEAIKAMAAEVVFPTPDNLTNGSANYYLYFPPGGKITVIPLDFDSILAWEVDPGESIATADTDIFTYRAEDAKLRNLVNENPARRAKFLNELEAMTNGPFQALPAQIDAYCAQIRDVFTGDTAAYWPTDKPKVRDPETLLEDFDTDCKNMHDYIAKRTAAIRAQLPAK